MTSFHGECAVKRKYKLKFYLWIFSKSKIRNKNPRHVFLDFILFFNITVKKFGKKIIWSCWSSQKRFFSIQNIPISGPNFRNLVNQFLITFMLFDNLKIVCAIFYQFFIFTRNDSPSKTEKYFLFHLKSFFHSQDIQTFVFSPLPLHLFQI